jgi:tetratricopeptide (TPR) repeat protein
MKIKIQVSLFLLLSYLFTFSQDITTEEHIYFDAFKKDSIHFDLFKGLSLIDSTFTNEKYVLNKNKIDKFIQSLPEKANSDKKEKKRIKKIYDLVHRRFFNKYDGKIFFNSVFTNGTYNCVTATAIYVYIFDALNIPYQIKELPSHVFLIAYPNKYKIHLETTVPGAYGFYVPSRNDIIKIIDELVKIKLVTKEEVLKKGHDKVYNDYFYGKKSIKKSHLIGMQYYNKSIFEFNDNNYSTALKNIEKSLLFYKNPYSKLVLNDIILATIKDTNLNTKDIIIELFDAIQLLKYKTDIDEVIIKYALDKIVINDDNDLAFIESLLPIFKNIKEASLKKDCLFVLYEYIASKHYNKSNYKESIVFMDALLSQNPKNKKAKEMMSFAIQNELYVIEISDESVLILEKYLEKYPFLLESKKIINFYIRMNAYLTQKSFIARDEKKGNPYFEKFEKLLIKYKSSLQINPLKISEIYLLVGRFYYGKSRFKEAKKIFSNGSSLYPNNKELKKMLKWTIEDMR